MPLKADRKYFPTSDAPRRMFQTFQIKDNNAYAKNLGRCDHCDSRFNPGEIITEVRNYEAGYITRYHVKCPAVSATAGA